MSGLFNRHISGRLAAYVEGQLGPRQAQRVREHAARCDTCREKLARHERLAADLRLALGHAPTPRPPQIEAWWQALRVRPAARARRAALPALLPAILSVTLLVVPFLVGYRGGAPHVASTLLAPAVDTTVEPPDTGEAPGRVALAAAAGAAITATWPATEPVGTLATPGPAIAIAPTQPGP